MTSKNNNAMCVYDFTVGAGFIEKSNLIKKLNKWCKDWTFQGEKGEKTNFEHWQGRLSLKVKLRLNELVLKWDLKETHFSITSSVNRKNNFYVLKDDTRTEGPYESKDYVSLYIPRQIREISKLYPWQQYIVDNSTVWDTRTINVVVDIKGEKGKSILCEYMMVHRYGEIIPFCNNFKDLMRMVYDMPTSTCYLIDMPRAINKENLHSLYSGIEYVKNGYVFDDRYTFKRKIFDCPNIWVFTNKVPDMNMLSNDRWKIWMIDEHMKLIPYVEECLIDLGES